LAPECQLQEAYKHKGSQVQDEVLDLGSFVFTDCLKMDFCCRNM